ncbi:hypothetical protein IMY05_C4378000700 [Salix suchowensis]|nr:hypothetical protein IMY05_C4378000700 [Salix suchowensis]
MGRVYHPTSGQMLAPRSGRSYIFWPKLSWGLETNAGRREDEEEVVAPAHTFGQHNDASPERVLQEVKSRVESPEYKLGDHRSRKSEAGVVGLIADPAPPQFPPVPRLDKGKGREILTTLVRVADKAGFLSTWTKMHIPSRRRCIAYPTVFIGRASLGVSLPCNIKAHRSLLGPESPPPAPAQAIVAIDAAETSSKTKHGEESSSAVRRLFSLTRRNSVSSLDIQNRQSRGNPTLLYRTRARQGRGFNKWISRKAKDIEATTQTKPKTRGVLRSKFRSLYSYLVTCMNGMQSRRQERRGECWQKRKAVLMRDKLSVYDAEFVYENVNNFLAARRTFRGECGVDRFAANTEHLGDEIGHDRATVTGQIGGHGTAAPDGQD